MALDTTDIARLSPAAQKQILAQMTAPKKQKYGNRKTTVNGIKFDSAKEAKRYTELLALVQAGEIEDLRLQADFTLVEAYTDIRGQRVNALRYRADFTYTRFTAPDCYGKRYPVRVVEDVKGVKTDAYKIKKKLLKEKYGIDISEV